MQCSGRTIFYFVFFLLLTVNQVNRHLNVYGFANYIAVVPKEITFTVERKTKNIAYGEFFTYVY